MSKAKFPVTPATRFLREHQIEFTRHLYRYEERGGTAHSAASLGVDEHSVIKTLILEDDYHQPLIALMHGDCKVSTRELARVLGAKTVTPCAPAVAQKHTGYLVGGTSPFGVRKIMPIVMQATILDLPLIYINGGKRGFLVSLPPTELQRLLQPTLVNVAVED